MHFLDFEGERLRLEGPEGSVIDLGRATDFARSCNALCRKTVSRFHAQLTRKNGIWSIKNVSDSNFVLVNNIPVGPQGCILSVGDRVQLGSQTSAVYGLDLEETLPGPGEFSASAELNGRVMGIESQIGSVCNRLAQNDAADDGDRRIIAQVVQELQALRAQSDSQFGLICGAFALSGLALFGAALVEDSRHTKLLQALCASLTSPEGVVQIVVVGSGAAGMFFKRLKGSSPGGETPTATSKTVLLRS